MDERWITPLEAADLTGFGIGYIRRLLRRGSLAGWKVSRDWLIRRESLDAYLAEMAALGGKKHDPWSHNRQDGRGRRRKESAA